MYIQLYMAVRACVRRRRRGVASSRYVHLALYVCTMAADAAGLMRVAVVGAGSISREFALHHFGPATGTVVVAVVDLDEGRALQLATDVGSVQAGAAIRDGGGSKYRAATCETKGRPVAHGASTHCSAHTLIMHCYARRPTLRALEWRWLLRRHVDRGGGKAL